MRHIYLFYFTIMGMCDTCISALVSADSHVARDLADNFMHLCFGCYYIMSDISN